MVTFIDWEAKMEGDVDADMAPYNGLCSLAKEPMRRLLEYQWLRRFMNAGEAEELQQERERKED